MMTDDDKAKVRVIENAARESALRFKRCGVSKVDYLRQASLSIDDMRLPLEQHRTVMAIAERIAAEVYEC